MRLQLLRKSQQFFKCGFVLLALGLSPLVYANEEIKVADIMQFGKNLTNTKLFFKATIWRSKDCSSTSDKGFYCLEVQGFPSGAVDWVLVADGKYDWRTYKSWIDTKAVLQFRGTVQMREVLDPVNGKSKIRPDFIVQDIAPIAKN